MIEYIDPSLQQLSESLIPELVPPPIDGKNETCWRCRTWTEWTTGECWNCAKNRKILGTPAVPLDLISLYTKPSQLRQWLTCYKGRIDESEPFIPEYVDVVKALVARFFYEHGERIIERCPVDVITVVPSSSRPGPHPLEALLNELPLTTPVRNLLHRGPGELNFNKPSRDGFVTADVPAQRVYLIDDVYTTGARVNSAAHALAKAGHQIVGTLVLARRINIGYKRTPEFWENQQAQDFTWDHSPLINSQHLLGR